MGVTIAAMTAAQMIQAALAAAAVAASAASYAQTVQANKAQDKAAEDHNKRLNEEAIRQYGELDKVEADVIYESHAKSLEAQRQFMTARSDIQLQAAVTGTYGNSVNLALQDLKTGFGGRMADITHTRDVQLDEVTATAESVRFGTRNQKVTALKKPAFFQAIQTGIGTYGALGTVATGVATAFTGSRQAVPTQGKTTGRTTGKIKR